MTTKTKPVIFQSLLYSLFIPTKSTGKYNMKNRMFIKTQILFPKYVIPVILIIIMLLAGCVENSALSDVEIEDPSIIKPIVEINKSL